MIAVVGDDVRERIEAKLWNELNDSVVKIENGNGHYVRQHRYRRVHRPFTPFEVPEALIAALINRAQLFNIIKIALIR